MKLIIYIDCLFFPLANSLFTNSANNKSTQGCNFIIVTIEFYCIIHKNYNYYQIRIAKELWLYYTIMICEKSLFRKYLRYCDVYIYLCVS